MSSPSFSSNSPAESHRLLDFEKAEVRPGFVTGTFILIVFGQAPCINMNVVLSPLIYIACPEYWGIEVVGQLPGGICLDTIKPYTVTHWLAGITGSKGIEVIGASKRKTFDVTGGCNQKASFTTR